MSRQSIFIVDDDEGHATLVRASLEDAGIVNPVRWFSTGEDVLTYLSAAPGRKPLVVLLDLNMPGIRGTEVLKRMRSDERTESIPVIVITTSIQPWEIDECYALGCNHCITKPMHHDEFVDAARALGVCLQFAQPPGRGR